MKISACVITLNEEENLPRCLESLKPVADEIIIVDSGSTDATCRIAGNFGAKIIPHEWEGFVGQKNFAVQQADHDWVLLLDADENLSPQLQDELTKLKMAFPTKNGFLIPRVVIFQGKEIRFGDWYPDFLVRLFRKGSGKFTGGSVHERLELEGPSQKLNGEIHHHTYKNWQDQRRRIERYAQLWADDARAMGKRSGPLAPWLHGGWRFFRNFLLKNGWRGGFLGFQIARATAYETFLKYKKLSTLKRTSREDAKVSV